MTKKGIMNKFKFSIEEATQLRLRGKTYRQIAQEIGCSIAWCKKNLANISPGEVKDDLVKVETKQQVIDILQDALKKVRSL